MDWLTADLVIGVEQGLGEQIAHMSPTEAVDHSASVSLSLDEPSETQLGEVLAGNGGTTASHLGQRRNVGVVVP